MSWEQVQSVERGVLDKHIGDLVKDLETVGRGEYFNHRSIGMRP
ncbi:MAG: hypothetical protein R2991_01025 [Thermoanaerobaculia bacterium]